MAADDQDTTEFGTAPGAPAGMLLKDRYLLIRQLNEGGFGTVHLAHDQQMHGRPVVVKIQINQRIDDPWFERKFNEEVRALSMIDHPGVVVAIDSGRTPDGKPFLVMQYVDGVTLRAVMNPEGMPLDRAANILKQVGHALGAAHDKGIWHRDLKPENLMLQTSADGSERVRLIDFGIATVANIKNKYQTTTRVAGSVLYMAPEQAIGQPSAQTDIYAMGLIAYEMVTGRRAFIADNAVGLAHLQRDAVRIRPRDLRPDLSITAERLILKSLEYEPSRRPAQARAFGDDLHDALLESSATRLTGAASTRRRNRKKTMIASLAAAAVLIGLAAYVGYRNRPQPPKAEAAKTQTPATDANAESAVELAFWNSVKDSTEPQLYREYLAKYPQGRFASLANAKIEILTRKTVPKPPATAAKADNAVDGEEIELAFWNSVKDATDPQFYKDYLKKYPNGRFASLASTKLDALTRQAPSTPIPGIPDLRGLAGVNPKMAAELSEWSGMKNAKDPQPYRDYLAKYPNGMFASVARIKIAGFDVDHAPDPTSLRGRIPLPPLRRAISEDDYTGPQQGELHWSGLLAKGRVAIIQAGRANTGSLTNDLPRVPVTVEVTSTGARVVEPPSLQNHWDRVVIKNYSDSPLTEFSIRWKVAE